MKQLIVFIAFIFLVGDKVAGQTKTFSLSDTAFTVGSVFRGCPFLAPENGQVLVRPEDQPCLDSVAVLLIAHPGMVIEIGSHTDQRGGDTFNLRLSQQHANQVKKYLESKNIPRLSVVAVGYGESQPINKQADILKLKTKQEQELKYQENRRLEFKILVAGTTFTLQDTSFDVGDILRPVILFDLAKATLRPESKVYLDTVAQFLIAHPQLTVEIRNHADTRASNKSSQKLSQARAKSIADYLISNGVPAIQVMPKGYEETSPLITEKYIFSIQSKDAQEQLHQLNRRTEFVITGLGQ